MRALPIPPGNYQLDRTQALLSYSCQYLENLEAAQAAVSQAFGLKGGPNDQLLLAAMLWLVTNRLQEGRALLLQIGLMDPSKIPAIYDALAVIFKYFTYGLPTNELVFFAVEPMRQLYQTYPNRPDVQAGLLDMLLYLGRLDMCERVLAQADAQRFRQEVEELAVYRMRLAQYRDECRLSIVLLTYHRPALLRGTLRALRAALAEVDVEIIVGVNDDWLETRQVLQEEAVTQVLFNECNTGIEFYKQVFAEARGEYIIEIDDDIYQFPTGFDHQIIDCLTTEANLGLVGHWPAGFIDAHSGEARPALPYQHIGTQVNALPFGLGPVSGACAGLRRRDFLTINGFSRGTLSNFTGEESQLIRKLSAHNKQSGVIFDQGLFVYVNG